MNINKKYYIGIDGGGTKTAGVIGNNYGEIVGYTMAESTNIQVKGLDSVKTTLMNMISILRKQAKIELNDINTIYLSLSGAGRELEKNLIIKSLEEYKLHRIKVIVENDAICALASGTYGESGIVLIAGTGSISYCYNKKTNELNRVGGWGYVLGDEGSGYDIGRQALVAIMKSYDGRGKSTQLTEALKKHLSLRHETDIIPYVYQNLEMRSNIASLAKVVFEVARSGDDVAIEIINNSIDSLIELVKGAFLLIDKKQYKPPIVLCGGLFSNLEFKDNVIIKLKKTYPSNEIIIPKFPPVIGAYVLSLIENNQNKFTRTIQQAVENSWNGINKLY